MILKSEAVKAFLTAKTHPDLSSLYHKGMEVQVNVAQGKGKRIETGGPGTKSGFAYSDGVENWKAFRIPSKAMSDPVDNDGPLKYNFDEHVEAVGMTGWSWQNKASHYVGFDFDSMMGHSEKHQKKLTELQLQEVQKAVTDLPFVTIRKSTSGKGLHLYIFLEPIETVTHTEHASLARSLLSYISGVTGFNFTEKVDICGGIMWVWHRKMQGTDGLKLIRQGTVFPKAKVPANWRDHLNVISRKSTRIVPKMANVPQGRFEELSGQRSKVPFDAEHLKLVNWLHEHNYPGWWDTDNHMLTTHTYYLSLAHKELGFRGEFYTDSSGKDAGFDINCFCFPVKGGGWAIRRYGQGTGEHKLWIQDGKGWTRCYFNRDLSLEDVARLQNGVELDTGGYQFASVQAGKEALLKLGITLIGCANWCESRQMRVKDARQDFKILVQIPEAKGDRADEMDGWLVEKGYWRRLFNNPRSGVPDECVALGDYDDMVRHIISENGEDLGWVVSTNDGTWRHEPVHHVKLFLGSRGIGRKDIDIILGQAISNAWVVVNKPFEPEYPGDREWNRSSARFRIAPTLDGESLSFPTWERVLSHCGRSLDDPISKDAWCVANGIMNGADYLRLWLASLIRFPRQPLPYLAFYGPQDSGKSTFHEAFCQLILDGGYMDGAMSLISQGSFNGELQDSILCTLEETDLRLKTVYQRVKDWVTSALISIHIKGQTPYKAPNYTHWIQCVNDRDFIPIFPGDTRVVVMFVDTLPPDSKIPKRDLWTLLGKEAPDFLAALLSTEIPDSRDRLMIPVIKTSDKVAAEFSAADPVQQFFMDQAFRIKGAKITFDECHKAFLEWIGPEDCLNWTKMKFTKAIPQDIVKGRVSGIGNQLLYLGNVCLDPNVVESKFRWISAGTYMRQEK